MEVSNKLSIRMSPFARDHHPQSKRKKDLYSSKLRLDHRIQGSKSRKSIDQLRTFQSNRMVFVQDPLNLTAICNKQDGSELLQTDSDLISLNYEPSNNTTAIHSKDPLNLNKLDTAVKDQSKPVKKRKKRKRRNTSGDINEEKISVQCKDHAFSDTDLTSPCTERNFICVHPTTANIVKKIILNQKISSSNDNLENHSESNMNKKKLSDSIRINCKNEKYKHGNIDNYYGVAQHQLVQKLNNRCSLFNKEWFVDFKCLDIGCNTGHVTNWIAKNFEPKHITGVDIDTKLIKIAQKNIGKFIRHPKHYKFPKSFIQIYGSLSKPKSNNPFEFPNNISFSNENYVPPSTNIFKYTKPSYDVILCLNVCKWVHLNNGDEGLKRMFKKIYLQLNPGGRFFIQFQHFSSYAKHKLYTREMFENYNKLKLMPNDFIRFLLSSEVGFTRSESLGYTKGKSGGRDRPLFMLLKSYHPEHKTTTSSTTAEDQ